MTIEKLNKIDEEINKLMEESMRILNNDIKYEFILSQNDLVPLSNLFKRWNPSFDMEKGDFGGEYELHSYLKFYLSKFKFNDLYIITNDINDKSIIFYSNDLEIIINFMNILRVDKRKGLYINHTFFVKEFITVRRLLTRYPNLDRKIRNLLLTLDPVNIMLAQDLIKIL